MGNLVKISTQTAGSGGVSSFQFSGIPSTYQDIFIVMTGRSNRANSIDAIKVYFNTDTTAGNYRIFRLLNSTTSLSLETVSTWDDSLGFIAGNNATASNFSSTYLYIGNYSGTTLAKSMNMRSGGGDNSSTSARSSYGSMRWSGTAAINQVTILPQLGTLFQEFSTATLYGILPQTAGGTGSKAIGGTVTTAGGYTYHAFTATGSLVPTTNITGAEVLVVAGGGGGGGGTSWASGGGGAGGLVYASGVSLTSGIKYPAIVGAGGLAGSATQSGKNGYNSSFGNQTVAVGGGGGGGYQGGGATTYQAQVGGSGGGGPSGQSYGGTDVGAAGTAGQGNAGGNSYYNPYMTGGGGGGAGASGGNATTTVAGSGGAGVNTYSAWGSATSTGQNISGTYWFAGGGGGSSGGPAFGSLTGGIGGNGGGGYGASSHDSNGSRGLPNTGGGGGGKPVQYDLGSGGSGVVIIRYTT